MTLTSFLLRVVLGLVCVLGAMAWLAWEEEEPVSVVDGALDFGRNHE